MPQNAAKWAEFFVEKATSPLLIHSLSLYLQVQFCKIIIEYNIKMEIQNNDNQLKIELSPEVAEGTYANLAIITHSSAEVVLDFIRVLPGVPKANVKSRIVLAPEHAKRLLFALQDNVMKYEKAFGPINLPGAEQPQGGRTATPFGVPEGKA